MKRLALNKEVTSDILDMLSNHFKTDVMLVTELRKTNLSDDYIVNIGGIEYVLKIFGFPINEEIKDFADFLCQHIKIGKVVFHKDNIVIMENVYGFTLRDFYEYYSVNGFSEQLKEIYTAFGEYLRKFHSIYFECSSSNITPEEIQDIIKDIVFYYVNYISCLFDEVLKIDSLDINKNFIEKLKNYVLDYFNTDTDALKYVIGLVHHNVKSKNVILKEVENEIYTFDCLVNYESIGYDIVGNDLAKVYIDILNESDTYFETFLSGYFKDCQEDIIPIIKENFYLFIVIELLSIFVQSEDADRYALIKSLENAIKSYLAFKGDYEKLNPVSLLNSYPEDVLMYPEFPELSEDKTESTIPSNTNLSNIIAILKDYFKSKIEIKDILNHKDNTFVYSIVVNNAEYVLKYKNSSHYSFWFMDMLNLLRQNVKIADIVFFHDDFIVMKKVKGISLNKASLDCIGSSDEETYSLILDEICTDFGHYMWNFHRSFDIYWNTLSAYDKKTVLNDAVNSVKYSLNYLYSLLLEQNYANLDKFLVNRTLELIKDYFRTYDLEKTLCIVHGDFHNSGNIMLAFDKNSYKFDCVVDYDGIRHGFIGNDLSQIYYFILNKSDKHFKDFMKGYLKDCNETDVSYIEKSFKTFYIINLLEIFLIIDVSSKDKLKMDLEKAMQEYIEEFGCD